LGSGVPGSQNKTAQNMIVFCRGLLCLILAQPLTGAASPPGLKGTTTFRVTGGAAGSKPSEKVMSVEFAVAPMVEGRPAYPRALFVTSDADGSYAVSLAPGKYWIGPPSKARNPEHYTPEVGRVVEQVVLVQKEGWTHVDVVKMVAAPGVAPSPTPAPRPSP
jgi:hypothetical protein